MCWLFPGETIAIDAPCLDCGEPIRVQVRDGAIVAADPPGIVAYVNKPFRNWRPDMADS